MNKWMNEWNAAGAEWFDVSMIVRHHVDVLCMQLRSDSIQDFSFVRDADRFSTTTKHLNDSYLRTCGSPAQSDAQKEIPPAGLSGLYFVCLLLYLIMCPSAKPLICVVHCGKLRKVRRITCIADVRWAVGQGIIGYTIIKCNCIMLYVCMFICSAW